MHTVPAGKPYCLHTHECLSLVSMYTVHDLHHMWPLFMQIMIYLQTSETACVVALLADSHTCKVHFTMSCHVIEELKPMV